MSGKNKSQELSDVIANAMAQAGDIEPEPLTADIIKHIAGKALKDPSTVSRSQVQKLAASVLAHIEPRGKS